MFFPYHTSYNSQKYLSRQNDGGFITHKHLEIVF
nr:MAG TPA: hypothetical protein [Bacteriophage sp.]